MPLWNMIRANDAVATCSSSADSQCDGIALCEDIDLRQAVETGKARLLLTITFTYK